MLINNHLEVIIEKINGDVVLSSIVLLSASNEALREEEARDPEDVWQSIALPVSKPLQSFKQVLGVATQTLERWETPCEPHGWHLTYLQAVQRCLQLRRQQDFTLDCFLEVLQ